MKPGFTLIEVLIATAIAAIISVGLFGAFYQINRSVIVADDVIDVYAQAALLNKQFAFDLSGATIPPLYVQQQKEKEKKEQDKAKPQASDQQKPQAPQQTKQEKPLTKIFYGINKDKNLDILTFISNNPLRVYWGAQTGKPQPALVRVVYRLQRKKGEDTYTLTWQESPVLDFDAYDLNVAKPIKAYELANSIKSCSVTYIALIEKKEKPEEKKPAQTQSTAGQKPAPEQKKPVQQPKREYKEFNEWNREEQKDKDQEERVRLIPYQVKITCVLWDDQRKKEREFIMVVPIFTDVEPIELPAKKDSAQNKQAEGGQQNQQVKDIRVPVGARVGSENVIRAAMRS